MSKHFYNYLAGRVNDFFNRIDIKPGEKYHIQFERTEQVQGLITQVCKLDNIEPFYLETQDGGYQSICIVCPTAKVLIASNLEEVTPDFLTTLRNKVGTTEDIFNDKAMLLIHNSNLDSLVQGMTSFSKEGMPFHIQSIESNLHEMMHNSRISNEEKIILKYTMTSNKNQKGFHEQITLFDYENVLTALNEEKLEAKDYKKLGLFYDSEILNTPMSEKDITERLKDNQALFSDVEMIHQYGPIDIGLERHFDEHGVKILSQSDWQDADFGIVRRSNQKKLEGKMLEYIESNKKFSFEGLTYWEKADGESKSKQRKRNIIVFNPEQHQTITLDFTFNDFIKNQYIFTNQIKHKMEAEQSGKRLKVKLSHEPGETSFYGLKYKTEVSPAYEFRIAIVETSEKFFQSIQTSYTLNLSKSKKSSILINSDDDQWILNKGALEVKQVKVSDNTQENEFLITEDNELVISKNNDKSNDEDLLFFQVHLPHTIIPFAVQDVVERPIPISGFSIWKLKREKQEHFVYHIENEKMKIIQGTRETYAQGDFKRNLERELNMIESNHLYFIEESGEMIPEVITVSERIRDAYTDLLRFFRANDLLPSLAFFDEEYTALAKKYVDIYLEELNKIQNGQSLDQAQRDLALIGTVRKGLKDPEWLFTPLHPLNLAYQLQLNELIGAEVINDELLRSLRPTNLLPYVTFNSAALYKANEQNDSYEWTTFVGQNLPKFESSKFFVGKLVQEKIEEFTEHFSYLFEIDYRAPLKINTINMGDCREILQGLIEYYKRQLKSNIEKTELLPIELHIYSEKGISNVFEEISQYSDAEEIASAFNLKLDLDGYHPEELLNIFRDMVKFYSQDIESNHFEYCHIAFYQMRKIEQVATSNSSELITGVSLFGLVSGVPSTFIHEDYKTGFGMKYYPKSEVPLLELVPKLNSLLRVASTLDNYQENMNIVTAISATHKQKLDAVYDTSHWVTFIDPKVDLSFFKNNDAQKDLLVIHYSDQYTSSSGFDAITVTRRSKQYERLIEEFLRYQGIEFRKEDLPLIINFFNAINGNWLLRLLAQKNQFPREKISILSAVKLALASLFHEKIIWIPISMEEVLRISGGTGLRQADGLFSARNLGRFGSYSDDLLLIGIEEIVGEINVHLYPIEVKIGNNPATVYDKAISQVKKTKGLLKEFLSEDNFKSKLYRNFFIQLAIASAEKMRLYSIWSEQSWDKITDSVLREKLINDDYNISNTLEEFIGQGAVISFRKDIAFTDIKNIENVLVFDYPEKSGFELIIRTVEEIKNHVQSNQGDLDADQLLTNLYKQKEMYEKSEDLNDLPPPLVAEQNGTYLEQRHNEVAATAVEPTVNEQYPSKPLEVLFGQNVQTEQEVKWFPTTTDKVMHTNTGIIGTMGTGKTQFTKSLITQLSKNDKDNVHSTPIGILIFDYKGDYIKPEFVDVTNAKVYDLYHLPYNPLSLYITKPIKPLLPMHTSNSLTDTIARAYNLGQVQSITLKDLIMDAYAQKGILKADASSWEKAAPTLTDVYKLYASRDDVKIDSLYAALKELNDTEVFEPNSSKTIPLFEMINGITVINLSGFSESIQNLVVSITLDVFYNQMQMQGHSAIEGNYREITRMILVDEADNFLSKNFTSIKKILKEGREYGVGTILSTQFLNHFSTSDNDYANYILTWIVHNVSEMSAKEIRMVFGTQSKAEEENIMNRIKSLKKHFSIVKIGSEQPVWMRDKAFWELI